MGYARLGTRRRDFFHPIAPSAPDDPDWGASLARLKSRGHYLDPFLANLKKDAHLKLLARWGGVPRSGLTLKTDLFEEAAGVDAFFHRVAGDERAVGMDLSPAITHWAKEREPHAGYLAGDARRLPFASNSFALIISPSTLDHFADPGDLYRGLAEQARVLVPGGRLIITLDNRQNLSDPLLRLANRLGWLPYYVGASLTIRELRAALESVGLAVSDTDALLHNPRLFAVGTKLLANRIGWRPLTRWVERALLAAQRLGETRWRYHTGSFIAALAFKPENHDVELD
jgi:SAM-dependent methyltransferase